MSLHNVPRLTCIWSLAFVMRRFLPGREKIVQRTGILQKMETNLSPDINKASQEAYGMANCSLKDVCVGHISTNKCSDTCIMVFLRTHGQISNDLGARFRDILPGTTHLSLHLLRMLQSERSCNFKLSWQAPGILAVLPASQEDSTQCKALKVD